jgi:hypothetical protein
MSCNDRSAEVNLSMEARLWMVCNMRLSVQITDTHALFVHMAHRLSHGESSGSLPYLQVRHGTLRVVSV